MQRWRCTVCSHIYDPSEGDDRNDVPPQTAFGELLDGWTCPVCGAGKGLYEPV